MSEQILLIDDDVRLVGALEIRLKAAGYKVHTAHNGDVGISVAALFQPDVIVLDIRMPEMDGFEVCRLMRAVPELVDIPIIVLSANEETSTMQAILEAGGNVYLRKPYHPPQLMALLRETIERRGKQKLSA
jgi:DNA-binding response OmpR family regulator